MLIKYDIGFCVRSLWRKMNSKAILYEIGKMYEFGKRTGV
jgi:hypothetical protein